MAQFGSYLAPTVTTDVVYEQGGVTLFGDARIPVLLGEGQETRTITGIEMHRGSSAVADDLRVGENLTAQVDGTTRTFTLSYGPIVKGDGTGTVTADPTAVQLFTLDDQLNQIPLRVVTLNGTTRQLQIQDLLPDGSLLYATYYFKRTDTRIVNDNLSDQIPSFATASFGTTMVLSLSQPGYAGNRVTLALTDAGAGAVRAATYTSVNLDDVTFGGTYSGGADGQYEVKIDALKNGSSPATDTFKWRKGTGAWTTGVSITGSAQTLAEGVTVTIGATEGHTLNDDWTTAVVASNGAVGDVVYTSANQKDVTISAASGGYTGAGASNYEVQITATGTFKWRKASGTWTTGVSITGSAQTLAEGVVVTFGHTTGYTTGDGWSSTVALGTGGISDALAVSGNGSDVLSIELRRPDNTLRNSYDILNLIRAGINTYSGGQLTFVSPTVGNPVVLTPVSAVTFSGGAGQSTNTTFKLKNVPVVDGTNGGRITNLPSMVAVTVNNMPASVISLDGTTGLFVLANGVAYGAQLKASYYTNGYQDTFDLLPNNNAVGIQNVGYAPGRNDFYTGTDFLLGADGKIYWGNAAIATQGVATPGYVPFDATAITTQLVDEKMYLLPCSGLLNSINSVFTLPDIPCDGSGLGVVTDNPLLINVYVGADPTSAYIAGAVRVTRLAGKQGQFTLFNAPPATVMVGGSPAPAHVYATYWRNTMGNHLFTMSVKASGVAGQGTYQIQDQVGNTAPAIVLGVVTATEANAAITGLVWPASKTDLRGVAGRTPDETITLTFQDDGASVDVQALQASNSTAAPGILFRAVDGGSSPNAANPAAPISGTNPSVQLVSSAAVSDANAITVNSSGSSPTLAIVININRDTTDPALQTRTLQDIVDLVNNHPTLFTTDAAHFSSGDLFHGGMTAALQTGWDPSTKAVAGRATGFSGGSDAVTGVSIATRFKITSSRTSEQAATDGLGLTGGATTNAGQPTLGADGFLNQTFVDALTGVTFTLVDPSLALEANPNAALDYGFTTTPSPSYHFRPGDKITFVATKNGTYVASATPNLQVYGLKVTLPSTYGMNPEDTLEVLTHDRAGSEPNVGDYYYLDLVVSKSDAELGTIYYYTDEPGLYADMGQPLPENKASLGGHLMFLNGANLIAVRQVRKDAGLATASDATYIDAIAGLKKNLPGQSHKANVIVPMTTSEPVLLYLTQHLVTQASPRNKGEALGFVGMPLYAMETQAQEFAQALNSERVVLVYPGGAIVTLQQNNVGVDYAVGGEFLAAGLAGLFLNSANDVATDLTLQFLTGFKGLVRQSEEPLMDMMAQSGVTVLVQIPGGIEIRQYVTTSTDSVLKIEPYVTSIADYTRQRTRAALKEFIAKKNIQNRLTDIATKVNGLMGQLMSDQILANAKPAVVTASPTDSRVVNVTVAIQPMMSILWINVTFSLTAKVG